MSRKLVNKKDISGFVMLCCFLYAASYITRINFSALISEIIDAENITKSSASLITTALFVSYGAGQLIFGAIGDRVSSIKMIFFGMLATSILNLFMLFFSGNVPFMTATWFLNGFAQAIMWPSLAKITSDYLDVDGYKNSCVSIAVASNVATVGMYVISPLLLYVMPYKMIFLLCGAVGILMTIWWKIKIPFYEGRREKIATSVLEPRGNFTKKGIGSGVFVMLSGICIAICIQGILKDGITTWTPSFIKEVYNLPSSLSILITVTIPIFSIISYKMGGYIHRRFIKNEIFCASVFFLTASLASFLLSAVYRGNPIVCVLLAGVITGCMHGVNLMLICMIPGRFEKGGNVALVSGVFNFVSYAGSSISTYLIAKFAEIYNWQKTVLLWAVLSALGMLICLLCVRTFKKDSK